MVCESRDLDYGGSNRLAQLPSMLPTQEWDETLAQPFRVNETFGCKDFGSLNESTADCRQVVSVGRFLVTNTIREILGRQVGGPRWIAKDVHHFETMIEQMAVQVRGRIDKLTVSDQGQSDNGFPAPPLQPALVRQSSIDAWGLRSTPQTHTFIAWSKKLLALMIEKAYCTLYQPLQSYSDSSLWKLFRERQVDYPAIFDKSCINVHSTVLSHTSTLTWNNTWHYAPSRLTPLSIGCTLGITSHCRQHQSCSRIWWKHPHLLKRQGLVFSSTAYSPCCKMGTEWLRRILDECSPATSLIRIKGHGRCS